MKELPPPADDGGHADLDAELAVLAGLFASASEVEDVADILTGADFAAPAHQVLFRAVIALWAAQEPVTTITVHNALAREGELGPFGGFAGAAGFLRALMDNRPRPGAAAAHARIVWEQAVRRRVYGAGQRIVSLAGAADVDPAALLSQADTEISAMRTEVAADRAGQLMTGARFVDTVRDEPRGEPVVEGLLEHEERVICVGLEGDGKTTLCNQFGYCVACGVHPFRPTIAITPRRVLIIDLENPRMVVQRRLAGLQAIASQYPGWHPDNLWIWARPEGIDLRHPREAFILADVIRQAKPDLIVGGPIYKMIVDDGQHSEQLHSTVTRFWDVIRGRYGCALWLEHHPPYSAPGKPRVNRPGGSSIYSRWPEFGIGLDRTGSPGTLRLGRFRGDREAGRAFPEEISRNPIPGSGWPWVATKWAQGQLDTPLAG